MNNHNFNENINTHTSQYIYKINIMILNPEKRTRFMEAMQSELSHLCVDNPRHSMYGGLYYADYEVNITVSNDLGITGKDAVSVYNLLVREVGLCGNFAFNPLFMTYEHEELKRERILR